MKLKNIILPITFAFSGFMFNHSYSQEDISIGTSFSKTPNKNKYHISLEAESFWKIGNEKNIYWGLYLSTPLINNSDYWGSGGFVVKKRFNKNRDLSLKFGPYISTKSKDGFRLGLGIKFPYEKNTKIGFESGIEKPKNKKAFYLFGVNYNW